MTYGSIATPEDYAESGELLVPLLPDAYVVVLTRIAVALEQIARGTPSVGPRPLAPLPPVAPTAAGCPIHHQPWKYVAPGVSQRTGAAYEGFTACPVRGCDQRPRA